MDQFIAAMESKQRLDLTRLVSEQALGVGARIRNQAARYFLPHRITHDQRIAALKRTDDSSDAGRQQTFAAPEGSSGPLIYIKLARRLQRARDPLLAHGRRTR